MSLKVHENAVKNYHPEIMNCPFCNTKLKYCYAVSNKAVQFTSGKCFRIRNFGYKCPSCNDEHVYFSQTANKLCFKGYTYSAKVICMIDYYKSKHLGRESICDLLSLKGIEISDRNVDTIYKKLSLFEASDYDKRIKDAYEVMLKSYNQIRISIDCIGIEEKRYIILYDYFTGAKLALWKILKKDTTSFEAEISKYINKDLNISYIVSVRNLKGGDFVPLIKKLAPSSCKIIAFEKF